MTETLYRMVKQADGGILFVPVESGLMLDVPWLGQNTSAATDDYSNSDCGPACVAMWLNYRGQRVTVDDVSRATGLPRGYKYTMFADLDKAANVYGLDLAHQLGTLTLNLIKSEIDRGRPVIALVYYKALPQRYDLTYLYSHWILVVGYDGGSFFYHDPYWPVEAQGKSIQISDRQLYAALMQVAINGNTALQGIVKA